jgi:hypothetical protein
MEGEWYPSEYSGRSKGMIMGVVIISVIVVLLGLGYYFFIYKETPINSLIKDIIPSTAQTTQTKPSPPPPDQIITANLLASWDFVNSSDKNVVADGTSNGLNLLLSKPGRKIDSGSIMFDRTMYAHCLNVPLPLSFTFELLLRTSDVTNPAYIISFCDGSNPINGADGSVYCRSYGPDNSHNLQTGAFIARTDIKTSPSFPLSQMVHLVYVVSGTNLYVYVNGKMPGNPGTIPSRPQNVPNNFQILIGDASLGKQSSGLVAEYAFIRIYNTPLSPADVNNNYTVVKNVYKLTS